MRSFSTNKTALPCLVKTVNMNKRKKNMEIVGVTANLFDWTKIQTKRKGAGILTLPQ